MIAPDGTEWLTVTQAAARVLVRESTIYGWISRNTIRTHHIRTPGQPGRPRVYVHLEDTLQAEHAWRTRVSHIDGRTTTG